MSDVANTNTNPFIVQESPRASERTAREWVDFYLDLEAEVAQAKIVRSDDLNRTVEMHDLDEIRKARRSWERVLRQEVLAKSGAKPFGGLSYAKADLSR